MRHKLMIVQLAAVLAAGTMTPLPAQESAPPPKPTATTKSDTEPLPAFPDLTSDYSEMSILSNIRQSFTGKFKRAGRQIYQEEESTSSGPIGYNEYFVYDFDKNMFYRMLRDEQVYFESPLTIDHRVDAIRKGWIPAEGEFKFLNATATLSTRDIPLREDTFDGRPVQLVLREITVSIPEIGSAPARSEKSYSFVWKDKEIALPVKIAYPKRQAVVIVEYHNVKLEPSEADLFTIPEGYINLTPF